MQDQPLIQLRGIRRSFMVADQSSTVLDAVDLDIHRGEMVAIVGASGSGKSTLMNLIGMLDQPSAGEYWFDGREVSTLSPDELAALRREHFGFIFQRYHLLTRIPVIDNVAVPAIYLGAPRAGRMARALELLARLGIGEKAGQRPNQLSGGQQQRVSICRALMNGPRVILADEPTGALDSRSGEEVLKILQELHAAGHTVVLITHDASVARCAQRLIELKDGLIVSDSGTPKGGVPTPARADVVRPVSAAPLALSSAFARLREAFPMAWLAMRGNAMRTLLTMLGIIIGITSVVSIVSMGNAAQSYVRQSFASLGSSTLEVTSGFGLGDDSTRPVCQFSGDEMAILADEPYVQSITPSVNTTLRLRFGGLDANGQVEGVSHQMFGIRKKQFKAGQAFTREQTAALAAVAVIDDNTEKKLFSHLPPGQTAIGATLLVGNMPVTVVGITRTSDDLFASTALRVWMPYSTVNLKLLGNVTYRQLSIELRDGVSSRLAQKSIEERITGLHGQKDFTIQNIDVVKRKAETTTGLLKALLSVIAFISLLVGGIGVMNIMLVSVTERTKEIGLRIAVGARQSDILQQFLIESALVCLVGGAIGVALSVVITLVTGLFYPTLDLGGVPVGTVGLALLTSTLIGLAFGFIPARRAAQLNPVEALARE